MLLPVLLLAIPRRLPRKTFRERASYLTVLAHFSPWWLFTLVWGHALLSVANRVVANGGDGVTDIGVISLGSFLEAASWAALSLAAGQLLLAILAVSWAAPTDASGAPMGALTTHPNAQLRWTRVLYTAVWAAAFYFLAFFPGLHGSWIWWLIVGAKLVTIAIGNGSLHPLARRSYVLAAMEVFVMQLEKGLTLTPRGGVLGGNLVRQTLRRIAPYAALWAVILTAKFFFDLSVLIQTVATAHRILNLPTLDYTWGFSGSGAANVWICIGACHRRASARRGGCVS